MRLVYLLINEGGPLLTYTERWRIFQDKDACLAAARKLGFGNGLLGEMFTLSDVPGKAVREICGDLNITLIPVLMEGTEAVVPLPTEVHDCTCRVSLATGICLPGCPRGVRTGNMYGTWEDVPDDVLTRELYETRHGRSPPGCPECSSRIYDIDKGVCSLCALRARNSK